MKTGKVLLHIMNGLNVLALFVLVFKSVFFVPWLYDVSFYHVLLVLAALYGIKTWVQIKFEVDDPIRINKISNVFFHGGMVMIMLGIVMRVMHWPFSFLPILAGALAVFVAFILSMVLSPSVERSANPDILDDL